jgi:hypothetical protein
VGQPTRRLRRPRAVRQDELNGRGPQSGHRRLRGAVVRAAGPGHPRRRAHGRPSRRLPRRLIPATATRRTRLRRLSGASAKWRGQDSRGSCEAARRPWGSAHPGVGQSAGPRRSVRGRGPGRARTAAVSARRPPRAGSPRRSAPPPPPRSASTRTTRSSSACRTVLTTCSTGCGSGTQPGSAGGLPATTRPPPSLRTLARRPRHALSQPSQPVYGCRRGALLRAGDSQAGGAGGTMILDDVRGVCSPADVNPGQPVPMRVTAANRWSQTGVRVLRVWSWAGRTGVRVTWVNVGHSLPPQVNPKVARLGPRALVAQGIEHRFPKPCVAGSNPAGGTRSDP